MNIIMNISINSTRELKVSQNFIEVKYTDPQKINVVFQALILKKKVKNFKRR